MSIIISVIIAAILLTFILTRFFSKSDNKEENPNEPVTTVDVDCCGAHEVCEKETLLSENDEIIYFQDEDLDAFRLRNPASYLPEEIEQFREVLYTMRDDEVAGWLRSIQLRGIFPPHIVREEALMIVSEIRDSIRKQREKDI